MQAVEATPLDAPVYRPRLEAQRDQLCPCDDAVLAARDPRDPSLEVLAAPGSATTATAVLALMALTSHTGANPAPASRAPTLGVLPGAQAARARVTDYT
jgi:hypothetical protein